MVALVIHQSSAPGQAQGPAPTIAALLPVPPPTNLTAFDTVQTQNTFRSFITRFPFLIYPAMTLLLGWAPWYLTGEPTHLFFVPLLTALIMAPLVGDRAGLMNFLRRMVRVRAPWYTWMVALLLPGAIALAAIAIHVLLGGQSPDAAMLKLNPGMLGQVAFIAVYIFHSAFNFWTVALLVTATVEGGELGFASTFDTRLLTINALLVGFTAVIFIVATRGELGSTSAVNDG